MMDWHGPEERHTMPEREPRPFWVSLIRIALSLYVGIGTGYLLIETMFWLQDQFSTHGGCR